MLWPPYLGGALTGHLAERGPGRRTTYRLYLTHTHRAGQEGRGEVAEGVEEVESHAEHTQTAPFGESSYFFGTNIPGKPKKYLLNSGGRPKLFKEIARVVETDYKAFRLSRSSGL